jgi:hypothetical protein
MSRQLPPFPNLVSLRKQAKTLHPYRGAPVQFPSALCFDTDPCSQGSWIPTSRKITNPMPRIPVRGTRQDCGKEIKGQHTDCSNFWG